MKNFFLFIIAMSTAICAPTTGAASDHIVYSVYQNIPMGYENEKTHIDYYLNMGAIHGLRRGAVVEVVRQIPTYDLLARKLFKDMRFPIATLKIIHVERDSAIARIEKLLPISNTPIVTPQAVMIGDQVRLTN